jgi:hypothetical protein
MPLSKNRCPTLFTTGHERLTEGEREAFALVFGLLAFWYGRPLEGKRIAKGKLLKRV